MAKKVENMTDEELEQEVWAADEIMDKARAVKSAVAHERDARAAKAVFDKLNPSERAALAQHIEAVGIESEEALGDTGGANG